ERHLRGRALYTHLFPGGVELLGDDRRQPGPHALSRLEVLRQYRNGVVGSDVHERHRERTGGRPAGGRAATPATTARQSNSESEPGACKRGELQELPAG